MLKEQAATFIPTNLNRSVFLIYMILLGVFAAFGIGYLFWKGKLIYLALIAAVPVIVLVISNPKLAVGQYILFLFYSRWIMDSPILYADLSGFLLLSAALLDLFSGSKLPDRFPRLSFHFLTILLVIFAAGIFSFVPEAAIRPFGRITLLFLHFLALFRLSGKVPLNWSLNFFYWVAVAHSVIVLIPFILSGGVVRSYGFAAVEMPMLALVIATSKYIWAKKGTGWKYLLGMVVIFFALLSAQYRSLIIIGVAMSALVAYFSRRRAKKLLYQDSSNSDLKTVKSRPAYLLFGLVSSVAVVFIIYPHLLDPLIERFESLLGARPVGSIVMRMTLWKHAWGQFIEHPWFGMGPGLFIHIQSIVPTVRMDFYYKFVHGLSAHNLVLHYLAETGIFGGLAVIAMMFNQMRLSAVSWIVTKSPFRLESSAILLGIALTFFATTLTESSWLWGQSSLVFAFFMALISRNHFELTGSN